MVQKEKIRRGRPRAYDPDIALSQAMNTFWNAGYAATSLDDLSAATGMNRPSLYAAFGDKRAIYRKALDHYRQTVRTRMKGTFLYERPLREAFRSICEAALSIFLSGENQARGCLMYSCAITEAIADADTRAALAEVVHEIDAALERRLRFAQAQGELPADAKPEALAKIAAAVLSSLSIRARAGEPREALDAVIEAGLDVICGPPRAATPRTPSAHARRRASAR
jgi:AcrR family transcriptional regulator